MVFGSAFIGAGAFTYLSSRIDSSWERTQGTVVSVSRNVGSDSVTYTPVVEYGVNGKDYTVQSNFSSSSRPAIGSSSEVAYNPNNPADAKLDQSGTGYVFFTLFPLIGLIVVVLGVFSFIKSRKRNKEIKRLLQHGTKITGVITDLQNHSSSRSHGTSRGTYKLTVAATTPQGETKHYSSDTVTGAVGLSLTGFQNTPVPLDVYIDQLNPNSYYVDVSGIPDVNPQKLLQLVQNQPPAAQQQPATPPFTAPTAPPVTPPPTAPPSTPGGTNQPPQT